VKKLKIKDKILLALSLTLILIVCIQLIATQGAIAQTAARKKTYAYIGALPNPCGVGQDVLLHVGITDASNWQNGPWIGLTVKITKPDGTTQTVGPLETDLTGGTGAVFVPTMVGNYTLQTFCPEQPPMKATVSGTANAGTILEASSSQPITLVVKQDKKPVYPAFSMPTEYWTRPIDSQIREWSKIAQNWVAEPPNLYAPYNDGPETAHILWTEVLEMGGLVGGDLGEHGMNTGDAYEGKFLQSVIINGILYYNKFNTQDRGVPSESQEVVAVDLHTGEELWSKPLLDQNGTNLSLSFGQTMNWDAFNNEGAFTYLWTTSGSTWNAHDALTGKWVFSITNIPSGTNIYGPLGEITRYTVNTNSGWMTLWNSTRTVNPQDTNSSQDGSWGRYLDTAQYPRVFPASRGIQWNVTIPKGLTGSVVATFGGDRIVGASISPTAVRLWGISVKPGQAGVLLFDKAWTPPADWAAGNQTVQWMASSAEDKVGVMFAKETCQNYGFSLETGDYMWGPTTPAQHYLDALEDTKAGARAIAYGKLYCASVSGIVYCYDVKTGKTLWTYEAWDKYTEILWANTWWLRPLFITDGKIYVAHYEHGALDPKPRGSPFICLDANTGEVVWSSTGLFRSTRWGGRAIIGDSIMATMDTYDQRVYAVGKGPSAVTVDAPMAGVASGSSVVLRGKVTDISPGTSEYGLKARFPNGVPAVADEIMSDWMLYVYKQFPKPADAKGVSVHLTAIDPNNNFQDIGTAVTDKLGNYAIDWVPPVPGLYKVTATFEGTKSYYSSEAGTAFAVSEPVAPIVVPTQPPTQTTTPPTTTTPPQSVSPSPTQAVQPPTSGTPAETYIAIGAVVVVVVVIAAALVLRRKKQ
jgi:outer membrane protein assembly factor BamB